MVRVGTFWADGFEEVEGITPVDMMRRSGFEVTTISVMGRREVTGSHEIVIRADRLFEDLTDADFEQFDALVLPGGGPGTQRLLAHEGVKKQIQRKAAEGRLVAAICAAPTVLAAAGLLDGKRATCYPGCEEAFSDKIKYTGAQVEEDGMIITANGPGAAFPFAFAVVRKLGGENILKELKKEVVFRD